MTHPCNCGAPCDPCRCGAEGERRKADALESLSLRRGVIIKQGRRVLLNALLRRGHATIDDVRAVVKIPARMNPKVFGCVPEELVSQGIIERVAFEQTGRPIAHARTVSIWKLADRDAAKRWLQAHIDLPDDRSDAGGQRLLFTIHPTNEPTPTVAAAGAGLEA